MLRTAWVLARKDFILYFRDRTALALSLLLPIFLATIFGAAMGSFGGSDRVPRVELALEDRDKSPESAELVAALQRSEALEIVLREDVRTRVAKGREPAALLIPEGYGDALRTGAAPELVLWRDPAQAIEQQIVAASLLPAVLETRGDELVTALALRALDVFDFPAARSEEAQQIVHETAARFAALAMRASGEPDEPAATDGAPSASEGAASDADGVSFDFASAVPDLLGIRTEDVAGGADASQKVGAQAHAVAGIAVMMLLFNLTACGATLLEEQAEGTLQRLQLAPHTGPAILLGKLLFTSLSGLMQLAVLFVYGKLVFDVPILRAPIALLVLSIAVVCAATGFGLLLAVLCRTRKQLEGVSTLFILVMSALGGSWFPLAITPSWYQKLGHFTLNAWAMDGYQGIFWYQKDLAGIALEILVLLAIAAVTCALAALGWKRRYATP